MTGTSRPPRSAWLDAADVRVDDLAAVTTSGSADHPAGAEVPVHDAHRLRHRAATERGRRAVQDELVRALLDGPGIVVVAGAFGRTELTPVTAAFEEMIAEQRATGTGAGDHFATAGANDRVWNALQKLAVRRPDAFVDYYANPVLALVCDAWLGPGYQVTSQVNVVNPGGAVQRPHRDYHLGFLPPAVAARYPEHVHRLSPALTLQCAVAHVDMPVESGPTMYLPGSQRWSHGYLAADREDVADHFARHHVQLPLAAGDAVFFNPALLHAAGYNRSAGIRRMANLLQVSSAFGRAMEHVDRGIVARAVFPALLAQRERGVPKDLVLNAASAAAEGYAFPTDLDADPPVDGLAPPTPVDVLWRAVRQRWHPDRLDRELSDREARRCGKAP